MTSKSTNPQPKIQEQNKRLKALISNLSDQGFSRKDIQEDYEKILNSETIQKKKDEAERLSAVYGKLLTKYVQNLQKLPDEHPARSKNNRKKMMENYGEDLFTPDDEILEKLKDRKLFFNIIKEFHKDHVGDGKALACVFATALSSYRPPKERNSIKIRGDSSVGKTNLVKAVIKHFPVVDYEFVTRTTRATLEDDLITRVNLIIQLEKHKDEDVNETIKQSSEDGMRVTKKDKKTNEFKDTGFIPRISHIDTSVDEESDEQVANRALIVHIENDAERMKKVSEKIDKDAMSLEISDGNTIHKETWITKVLQSLRPIDKVLIPFADKIPIEIDEPRKQRDKKRFYNLIRSIAYLHQYQRKTFDRNGYKYLEADIKDLKIALVISKYAFIRSISGTSPKIEQLMCTLKDNTKWTYIKDSEEIVFEAQEGWVLRKMLEKELDVSRDTIKKIIKQADDLGLVEQWRISKFSPNVYVRACVTDLKKHPLVDEDFNPNEIKQAKNT